MWEAETVTRKKPQTEEHMNSQDKFILSNRALLVNDIVYTQPSNMFRPCKQVIIGITFIKMYKYKHNYVKGKGLPQQAEVA